MLRAAPPPLRRLSLRGQLFLLVGFPRQERARLAEELARAQATLLPPEGQEEEAAGLSVLFVVANYWTDAAAPTEARAVRSWRESRRQRAGDARVEVVTRFWVLEMARVGHWIDPRLDLFFRPPPPPPTDASAGSRSASATLLLTYPVNYRDGADMEMLDAAGSAGASGQGQTKRLARLRLPCSPRHLFEGEVPLWPYVFGFLRQPLRNMRDLDALLRALSRFDGDRRLNCLETAIFKLMAHDEQEAVFERALPELARLVRELPFLFPVAPLLLTPLPSSTGRSLASSLEPRSTPSDQASIISTTLSFTKEEALALVACCFFSVMPDQDRVDSAEAGGAGRQQGDVVEGRGSRRRRARPRAVAEFPHFNMFRMFLSPPARAGPKIHKLRCVLQYFLVATKQLVEDRARMQTEVTTFSRVAIALPPEADALDSDVDGYDSDDDSDAMAEMIRRRISRLTELRSSQHDRQTSLLLMRIRSERQRLIEDLDDHLQMDFANMYPGGGVLGAGCVQEEIRFVLSPEMLVSCLVTAKLEPHEAFSIRGTERYCSYTGYGGSFEMSGLFRDHTPYEDVSHNGSACRRRRCVTVGVDATDYGDDRKGSDRQFSRAHMWRDLLKAFAGFAYGQEESSDHDSGAWPVASGNWGCGVFCGDSELKLLIQWLAASLAGRDLVYVVLDRDVLLKQRLAQLSELMASLLWHVPVQWLVEFLFGRDGEGQGAKSLWAKVRERHFARQRQQREGLRLRRGQSSMAHGGRGGRMGVATDDDGGGSGVLAMAIEALERELRSRSDSSADVLGSAPGQDALDAAANQSEDMEIDGVGGVNGVGGASEKPAASKKHKKMTQSTMDMFFS